jgi:hypothetical protein
MLQVCDWFAISFVKYRIFDLILFVFLIFCPIAPTIPRPARFLVSIFPEEEDELERGKGLTACGPGILRAR